MNENRYDAITGKPIDKTYLEKDLPKDLQKSLDAYNAGNHNNSLEMEPLWYDLYSEINLAYVDGQISAEVADHIRNKYLYERDT